MKIMVVDHDDFSAQVISGILRNLGFEIVRGRTGREALRLLVEAGNSVQLVIADVYLPEMGGLELFRVLRGHPQLSHTPVILTSGLPDKNLVSQVAQAGCSHFLVKPVSREKVQAKLRQLISMQRSLLKNPNELKEELSLQSGQLLSLIEKFYGQVFRFLEDYHVNDGKVDLAPNLQPLAEAARALGTDDLKETLADFAAKPPGPSVVIHALELLLSELEAHRERVKHWAREESAMAILVAAEEKRRARQSEMLDAEIMSVAGRLVRREISPNGKIIQQSARTLTHEMLAAAKSGDVEVQFDVGMAYLRGYGTVVDEQAGTDWLGKAAEKKHTQALVRVGLMVVQSGSVLEPEVRAEAADLWGRAAQKGSLEGRYWLEQLNRDPGSLVYLREAKLGNPVAQYQLGLLYEEQMEFDSNFLEAIFWYGLSAKQGYVESMFRLGVLHLEDRTTGSAKRDAANFFRAAAELAHVPSQYALARMYNLALGIPLDINQAIVWYERAARQGHAKAQFELAHTWETAAGMKPNNKEALRWYLICAAGGSEPAHRKIMELRKFLTAADLSEAEGLAAVTLSSIGARSGASAAASLTAPSDPSSSNPGRGGS